MGSVRWLAACLCVQGFLAAGASADHLRQANRLADEVVCRANELQNEIGGNYRGLPIFGRLVSQTNQLRQGAQRIERDLAAGHFNGLTHELSRNTKLVCQIENSLEAVDEIDFGDRHCRYHRVNTRVAHRLVQNLRDRIEDLQDELEDLCHADDSRGRSTGQDPRARYDDFYGDRQGASRPSIYFGNGRVGLQWSPGR